MEDENEQQPRRIVTEDSISCCSIFCSWLVKFGKPDPGYSGRLMKEPDPMVGLTVFRDIWDEVEKPKSLKVGIHAKSIGTGLTTLLNYLNNRFIHVSDPPYDYVFLCHSALCIPSIRNQIARQLGISHTEDWLYEPDYKEKARMLLQALHGKRFVILIDNIGPQILPSAIGVPDPTIENGCKFIFATQNEVVFRSNDPGIQYFFQPLHRHDSWNLFADIVGRKMLNSNSEISHVAHSIVDLCFDLPKVLVVIAGLMKVNKKLKQWQDDLIVMTKCHRVLKLKISRFKLDFAKDYYFTIIFHRTLAAGKVPLTIAWAPGLEGEHGKRLLAPKKT
ncbi:hypothetical protein M5689_012056 [Euphorbia peplus]|nr:hypothetical protein M5689_012056 [Euphorbia peplus]